MNEPVFSVILSTYNRCEILPRAVRSVFSQNFPNFELILIDNGSNDRTASIVQGFHDSRIRYFLMEKPSSSCDYPRQYALSYAKGKYICFLDDDDMWYPEKLEKIYDIFKNNNSLDVICHSENFRLNGKLHSVLKHGSSIKSLYETLLYEKNCFSPSATAINKKTLDKVGGYRVDSSTEFVSDFELWFRLLENGAHVFFVDEPLGEFCVTGTQNGSFTIPDIASQTYTLIQDRILKYEEKNRLFISYRGQKRLLKLKMQIFRSSLKFFIANKITH